MREPEPILPAREEEEAHFPVELTLSLLLSLLFCSCDRITEDTPQYQGVIVLNMADVPLGALNFFLVACPLETRLPLRVSC